MLGLLETDNTRRRNGIRCLTRLAVLAICFFPGFSYGLSWTPSSVGNQQYVPQPKPKFRDAKQLHAWVNKGESGYVCQNDVYAFKNSMAARYYAVAWDKDVALRGVGRPMAEATVNETMSKAEVLSKYGRNAIMLKWGQKINVEGVSHGVAKVITKDGDEYYVPMNDILPKKQYEKIRGGAQRPMIPLNQGKAVVVSNDAFAFLSRYNFENVYQAVQYDSDAAVEYIMRLPKSWRCLLRYGTKVVVLSVQENAAQIMYDGAVYWCHVYSLENI